MEKKTEPAQKVFFLNEAHALQPRKKNLTDGRKDDQAAAPGGPRR